jgi:hypothetical protein
MQTRQSLVYRTRPRLWGDETMETLAGKLSLDAQAEYKNEIEVQRLGVKGFCFYHSIQRQVQNSRATGCCSLRGRPCVRWVGSRARPTYFRLSLLVANLDA